MHQNRLHILTARSKAGPFAWTIDCLQGPDARMGQRALKALEAKLTDINAVVPPDKLEKLHAVTIVLDLSHGKLNSMQYHPDADWLRENGYDPRAGPLRPYSGGAATTRTAADQRAAMVRPPRVGPCLSRPGVGIRRSPDSRRLPAYKKSGHGDAALLVTGQRVRHYGLTDHKEFFAEMTEAYFGTNDFFPFNRGELMTAEPEIYKLLLEIWGPVQTEQSRTQPPRPATRQAARSRSTPTAAATTLWYAQPAGKWDEALPVGNGRLGAMVFGGPEQRAISG